MKNKIITINFLLHHRYDYVKVSLCELFKLEDRLKGLVKINLLTTDFGSNNIYKDIYENCKSHNLDVDVYAVGVHDNYMSKIRTGANNSTEYSVSIDEDIFISASAWTKFLDNIDVLDNNEVLFYAPVITTGIPTVDLFLKTVPQSVASQIENALLNTHIPNIWGADYTQLNKHTTGATRWDCEKFYTDVYNINHHYKGVHPVRFSYRAQEILNNYCIENIKNVVECIETKIVKLNRPYFCNSVFAIKTDNWKTIISDRTLFVDDFDEVPLNKYMENNDKQMAFLEGAVAVHPSYNTVDIFGHSYKMLSDNFFQNEYFKQ